MENRTSKNKNVLIYLAVVGVYLAISIIIYYLDYTAQWVTGEYTDEQYYAFTAFEYWGPAIWGIFVTILFVLVLKSFGMGSQPGKVWLFLVIGFVLWNIGDWYNTIYYIINQTWEIPEPNPARIAYMLGYVFLILGISLQIKNTQVSFDKKTMLIVISIILVALVLLLVLVTIPSITKSVDESLTEIGKGMAIGYAILDFIVIFLALLIVSIFRGGEFGKSWLIIALGFLVFASYDNLVYLIENLNPDIYYYTTDFIYYLGYWIIGFGALQLRNSLK
jgi:hypothetical protein